MMLKEAAMGWCNVLSYLPWGTKENMKDLSWGHLVPGLIFELGIFQTWSRAAKYSTVMVNVVPHGNINAINGRIVVTQVLMPLCIPKLCSDSMALKTFCLSYLQAYCESVQSRYPWQAALELVGLLVSQI
jgi:hypothetical protein